jgi:hypothetical protein
MKKLILVSASGFLFTATVASAQAPGTGRVTPEYPKAGSPAAGAIPGATGPGSEKNAVTSPSSPDVPVSKQPPADIPTNSGSSSGSSGTTGPHNPDTPAGSPQD